jgi:predicted O-linked N-acetylglucosamine transferase (SPINDLY family)
VAGDEDGYLAIAVALAGEAAGLREGRAGLRARMAASPLCDIDGYAAGFEALLRRMWHGWCSGAAPGLLAAAPG